MSAAPVGCSSLNDCSSEFWVNSLQNIVLVTIKIVISKFFKILMRREWNCIILEFYMTNFPLEGSSCSFELNYPGVILEL